MTRPFFLILFYYIGVIAVIAGIAFAVVKCIKAIANNRKKKRNNQSR